VKLLLEHNADVNKQAKDGNTALILGKINVKTCLNLSENIIYSSINEWS
jgi:ankyrin repeat protein